jgi:prepilin-type processing-associated H-X9-DG protein
VSNGWATTSLVLGILGFLIPLLPAVGAIIAGIVGLSRAHDPRVRVRGRGMAIAGISLGGVGLVIMTPALLVTLLLPRLSHAREQAQRIKSMSNLRQIGAAAMMYSNENRGYLPSDWAGLFPYVNSPSVFISPRRTASPAIPQDHDQWPQWVDSNSDYVWLGHGKLNFIPNPSGVAMAHEKFDDNPRGINILFCDAHVDYLPLPEARDLIEKSQQTLKQADNDTHH